MREKSFKARSAMGFLLLVLLLALIPPQSAQADSGYFVEYPFSRANWKYEYNMKLVLDHLSNGKNEWVIKKGATNVSFNSTAGDFTIVRGFYGYPDLVHQGDGACDVGTMLYQVATNSGLLIAHADDYSHPQIYGVPTPAITIWNPGLDLFISNSNDFDVVIRWDYESHPGYIKFWVERKTTFLSQNGGYIAGGSVAILLILLVVLMVFRKKNPKAYGKIKRGAKNTLVKIGRAAWTTYLILEQLIVGEPGSYKRMRNKIFLGAIFTVVSVVGCIFVIALLSVLNDHSVSPQKIAEKVADASPHLDNYLQFLNGEMPIMRSWTAPMTRSDNVLYTGVYGAIKGWGTLGETSNAVEAVIAAVKYANEVKSWYSGQVVPVVNVRINSDEIMTGIIELCRGKCIVMIDVTPNQDVLGIIRKWAPQGNHVWIDVDLEHRVIPTSAQEFNSWASEYFTIRQQSGFNSLGVFAFYDFRADPWLTPPQDVVWTYNNGEGIVVPIFDGHCAGTSCWEAKITSTSDVLSNYPGAQAIGIMEFLRRWGCGSQYGDCGFTAQQYWQKFQPLILMSQ